MTLKRKGFPQLSTESGQIGWSMGLWLLLFLGVLLSTCLQVDVYKATARYLEDALAASNLAAAVIDIEEYGISHTVRIVSPEEAYGRYGVALQGNLGLDDNGYCANKALITGPVRTARFIVYNVEGNNVEIFEMNTDGTFQNRQCELGMIYTPGGEPVEATGIYSEIECGIDGMFGTHFTAKKGKLVEVYHTE